MTIFVTWKLIVTLDSIRNSCDVFLLTEQSGNINSPQSTFFNVLTKSSQAAAENFPFCTIDPNEVFIGQCKFGGNKDAFYSRQEWQFLMRGGIG